VVRSFLQGTVFTRNVGGNPYLRMLSEKSWIVQICIHALKTCMKQSHINHIPFSKLPKWLLPMTCKSDPKFMTQMTCISWEPNCCQYFQHNGNQNWIVPSMCICINSCFYVSPGLTSIIGIDDSVWNEDKLIIDLITPWVTWVTR